jgi:S1-C subfamily serine protease
MPQPMSGWKKLTVGWVIAVGLLATFLWAWKRSTGNPVATNNLFHEFTTDPIRFATNRFTGGIGVALGMDPGSGLPYVIGVITGTPAEQAGLKKGDIILKINDKSTQGRSLLQVVEQVRGFSLGTLHFQVGRDGTNFNCIVKRTSWNDLLEKGNSGNLK